MTTKNFKAATLAATAVALTALLLVYPALVTSAAAQTSTSTTTSSATSTTYGNPGGQGGQGQGPPGLGGPGRGGPQQQGGQGFGQGQKVNVTDGETFTITSTSGQYVVVGSSTDNGTASGTLTFTVTGSLTAGDTLSISGTVVIAGTTYTISSGSAEMNPSATAISGQGTTTPTGEFLLQASAHGSFVGSNGQVSLDLSNGTTEYLVSLTGTVTS
jgi:hypothetical protein